MKATLTTSFFLAVLVLASANPRLSRRQATAPAPAPDAAPPTPDAPVAPPAGGVPPPPPPAPAAGPVPVAAQAPPAPPAAASPPQQGRARPPPPPPAPQPAEGPSVFVLPDGAGLILGQIKEGFTCEGKIYGYYADVSNECKIFHVCVPVLDNQGQATQPPLIFSFFCNNGTIFNQENLVCDYADNVDCSQSESHYSINQEFGKIPEGSQAAQGRSAAAPAPAPAAPAPVAPAVPAPAAPVPAAPAPLPAAPEPTADAPTATTA